MGACFTVPKPEQALALALSLVLCGCATVTLPPSAARSAAACIDKQVVRTAQGVRLSGLRAGDPLSAAHACVKRRVNLLCESACSEASVVVRPKSTSVEAVLLYAEVIPFESAIATWDELARRMISRLGTPDQGSPLLPWKKRSDVMAGDAHCVRWRDGSNNVGIRAVVDAEDLSLSVSVFSGAADAGCVP